MSSIMFVSNEASATHCQNIAGLRGNKIVGVIAMRDIMRHLLEAIQRTSKLVGSLVVCDH